MQPTPTSQISQLSSQPKISHLDFPPCSSTYTTFTYLDSTNFHPFQHIYEKLNKKTRRRFDLLSRRLFFRSNFNHDAMQHCDATHSSGDVERWAEGSRANHMKSTSRPSTCTILRLRAHILTCATVVIGVASRKSITVASMLGGLKMTYRC